MCFHKKEQKIRPLGVGLNIFCEGLMIGNDLRPDLFLRTKDNCLYILEFTIGFETYLNSNVEGKSSNYSQLVPDLRSQYTSVTFANPSMSSLGLCKLICLSLLSIDIHHTHSLISKLSKISIRTTPYIFCCRIKHRKALIYFFFTLLLFYLLLLLLLLLLILLSLLLLLLLLFLPLMLKLRRAQ